MKVLRNSHNAYIFLRRISCVLLATFLCFGSASLSAAAPLRAPNFVFLVTTPVDLLDAGPCGWINNLSPPGPDGLISLREAICMANNTPGAPHTINFAAPFPMIWIVPQLPPGPPGLPIITQPINIDGYSPPGYPPPPAPPPVVIDGTFLLGVPGVNGLTLMPTPTGPSLIRGLTIQNFSGHGIEIAPPATNVAIQSCHIGIDMPGGIPFPNMRDGIKVSNSSLNVIGGLVLGQGNLISGNILNGVEISGTVSTGNKIQGNWIGTDVAGILSRPNGSSGIYINNAPNTTVGGANPLAGNLISGNTQHGIFIYGAGSTSNLVYNNVIGLNLPMTATLPNSQSGIYIDQASNNNIGGSLSGMANTIAGNTLNGITIQSSSPPGININNLISTNLIYNNSLLGIDLGNDGMTANDNGDADTGANQLQNYPIVHRVLSQASSTTIMGVLRSSASTAFALEFYSSAACDASGYGEGVVYLGATQLSTDSNGHAPFSAVLPVTTTAGHFITALAIDPSNNTSEFSACRVVYSIELYLPLVKQ